VAADVVSPDQLTTAVLGEIEATLFENLYAAYQADAQRLARSLVGEPDAASDVVHSAYLEILRFLLSGRRWSDPDNAKSGSSQAFAGGAPAVFSVVVTNRGTGKPPAAVATLRFFSYGFNSGQPYAAQSVANLLTYDFTDDTIWGSQPLADCASVLFSDERRLARTSVSVWQADPLLP
jgi:hypothetical protein